MFKIRYKLGPSKIHGTGVFADENISRGLVAWEPEPPSREITQREFDRMGQAEKASVLFYGFKSKNTGKYVFSEGDVHFLNHSKNGNVTEEIAPNKGEGVLIAKRDIKSGEEITQDYREFESEKDITKRGISP